MNPTPGNRPNEQTLSLTAGFNQFGIDIQRRLDTHENTLLSPLSIGTALTAIYAGARGTTANEMAAVLHLREAPEVVGPCMTNLLATLAPRIGIIREWDQDKNIRLVEREFYRLSLATALFVAEAYPLHTEFRGVLTNSFGAEFFSDPFASPDDSVDRINAWVSERTEGRITDVLPHGAITEITRLVLANAVYFKARWADPFNEHATQPRAFFLAGGERIEVETMRNVADFSYWADKKIGARAVRIPYEQDLSMLVLLPDPGREDDVGTALSATLLARINAAMKQELIDLQLPRLELSYGASLAAVLKQLGMRDMFDETVSNFGGITPDPEGLVVSGVVHKAWVKVDEEGTEAAATTAVVMATCQGYTKPPVPIPFAVERPYHFLIQDERSGAILFLGHVMDPSG